MTTTAKSKQPSEAFQATLKDLKLMRDQNQTTKT